MEPENPEECKTRDRLADLVQLLLKELAALAQEQSEILRSDDQERMDAIDKRVETLIGEKERALGAFKQHRTEHGC